MEFPPDGVVEGANGEAAFAEADDGVGVGVEDGLCFWTRDEFEEGDAELVAWFHDGGWELVTVQQLKIETGAQGGWSVPAPWAWV